MLEEPADGNEDRHRRPVLRLFDVVNLLEGASDLIGQLHQRKLPRLTLLAQPCRQSLQRLFARLAVGDLVLKVATAHPWQLSDWTGRFAHRAEIVPHPNPVKREI